MQDLIIIGTIVKPQGIKGEVKIIAYSNDVQRLTMFKGFYIGGIEYSVEKARANGNSIVVKFSHIKDRNQAELLRGKDILIKKSELLEPEKGKYYIADLIGCDIIIDGNGIGKLTEILQHGSADVYVCKLDSGGQLLFPALKDVILEVNMDSKQIVLDNKRLQEVAVYEN